MKKHNRRIWGLVFAFVMMLANVMFVPMDFKTTEVNAAESGIEAMSSVEDIQEGLRKGQDSHPTGSLYGLRQEPIRSYRLCCRKLQRMQPML